MSTRTKTAPGPRHSGPQRVRTCKRCGCTYHKPCLDKSGMSCCWVGPNLCSACETPKERTARYNRLSRGGRR